VDWLKVSGLVNAGTGGYLSENLALKVCRLFLIESAETTKRGELYFSASALIFTSLKFVMRSLEIVLSLTL